MRYLETLEAMIGRPSQRYPAVSVVDPTLIRLWREAIGDENPLYHDEEVARQSIHGRIVAPPAMLSVWDMPGMKLARGLDTSDLKWQVMDLFFQAGFEHAIAMECERGYDRYLVPGEVLTQSTTLEKVSDLKTTRLGQGHYVVWKTNFFDAQDQCVGWLRARLLNYRTDESQ